eukprot:3974487-Prymnesium_polylepis.1
MSHLQYCILTNNRAQSVIPGADFTLAESHNLMLPIRLAQLIHSMDEAHRQQAFPVMTPIRRITTPRMYLLAHGLVMGMGPQVL